MSCPVLKEYTQKLCHDNVKPANLIYYFPGELALFHTLMSWVCPGRARVSQTRGGHVPDKSWACPRRELGVSQTRAGRVPDEWGG